MYSRQLYQIANQDMVMRQHGHPIWPPFQIVSWTCANCREMPGTCSCSSVKEGLEQPKSAGTGSPDTVTQQIQDYKAAAAAAAPQPAWETNKRAYTELGAQQRQELLGASKVRKLQLGNASNPRLDLSTQTSMLTFDTSPAENKRYASQVLQQTSPKLLKSPHLKAQNSATTESFHKDVVHPSYEEPVTATSNPGEIENDSQLNSLLKSWRWHSETPRAPNQTPISKREADWFLTELEQYQMSKLTKEERAKVTESSLRKTRKHRHSVTLIEDCNFILRTEHVVKPQNSCGESLGRYLVREACKAIASAYSAALHPDNAPTKGCLFSALMYRASYFLRECGYSAEVEKGPNRSNEGTLFVESYSISRSNLRKIILECYAAKKYPQHLTKE
mmetsp:Transcript_556/g.801  ORF Transcript_556/g.801 Transcript_556/m.801 type:complete len:390 (-) Transcript_556:421-1590(-)